jgi:hypothetical protein
MVKSWFGLCLGMAILPTGAGVGAIFHPRVRPAPAPRIGKCGCGFHFSPVGDPRISEISNFDGFNPVSHLNSRQPQSFGLAQHYPALKSRTVNLGGVHITHELRSSLGSSIHCALMIEFISTLLKPTGDPKPTRNSAGAGMSATFHPRVWPRAGLDECRGWGCGRIFVKPAPLPSLVVSKWALLGCGSITVRLHGAIEIIIF